MIFMEISMMWMDWKIKFKDLEIELKDQTTKFKVMETLLMETLTQSKILVLKILRHFSVALVDSKIF